MLFYRLAPDDRGFILKYSKYNKYVASKWLQLALNKLEILRVALP